MPRKVSGFTSAGIRWYKHQMALLILEGKSPKEAYEEATAIDGMAIQSLRQKISVKAIKKEALKISGSQTLEDYFRHKNNLKTQAA